MSRKKHKPARPHWERIASKRASGVNVVETPYGEHCSWFGVIREYRRQPRPANATPGQ